MAIVEVQVEQWQERAIQVLVLLSFSMQLVLLVLAEFRRRIDSGMLRVVIWSAYVLADSTALYTLGHLSVTSRSGDHKLMAFWAPFLLVHLGGQDNITAYAIEDNQLWRRHLQTLTVQVAAAAYILYESTIVGTQGLLRNAAVLMFLVGIVKYGERVWALKRANTSTSANEYQCLEKNTRNSAVPPMDLPEVEGQAAGTENLLRIAYLLLDVPKDMLQGPLHSVALYLDNDNDIIPADQLYKVVEMQLGLMHDLLYSKAEVIHTRYGLCIRVISPVFTAVAFMLFHRSTLSAGDHHYSTADVTITYVLLGGAVTLEMVSVVRAILSRWPRLVLWKLAKDCMGEERYMQKWCRWYLLAHAIACAIASIRRFVLLERHKSKWWSDSMGQQNLIELCIRNRESRASRIVSWMGIQDWWNTLVYSRSIPVSTSIKEIVVKHVLWGNQRKKNQMKKEMRRDEPMEEKRDHIINSWGKAALLKWGWYERLVRFMDMELDESILVWHVATDIYLHYWTHGHMKYATHKVRLLARAIEEISNYMFFLFVARPYMLPGYVSHTKYLGMCHCLTVTNKLNNPLEFFEMFLVDWEEDGGGVQAINYCPENQYIQENETFKAINGLAYDLTGQRSGQYPAELEMIVEVWLEMMCYAGYKCNGYSHAKQLSNGGELLTVAALMVEYFKRNILKPWSWQEMEEEEKKEEEKMEEAEEEEEQCGNLSGAMEIV